MIQQTLFLKFDRPIPGAELDGAFAAIEEALSATGVLRSFSARRHLPVAGEEQVPGFVGDAIVQLGVDDVPALHTLFGTDAIDEVFHDLRGRHPYSTAWVNHEALA